jgi:hypothetical protein
MAEALSDIATITAPALVGVWVFDPTDADESERNFIHADGRVESIDVEATPIVVRGRARPLLEFGETELMTLVVTVFIPFGPDHDVSVEWWRAAARNRRALCYRDNRGRLIFGGLSDKLGIADGRAGTALSVALLAIDYDEAT